MTAYKNKTEDDAEKDEYWIDNVKSKHHPNYHCVPPNFR